MAEKSGSTSRLEGRQRRGGQGPSAEKSRKLADAIEQLRVDHGEDAIQLAIRQGTAFADAPGKAGQDKFPVRLFAPDEYDQVAQLKTQADEKVWGQKTLTTDDLEYMKRKAQMQTAANFKQFVGRLYDAKDPAQAAILERLYPALNAERESIIDDRAELEKRLAKLRLRGPRNEDDLRLLYALAAGEVTAPAGALWDPKTWYSAADTPEKRMARGWFSPLKVLEGVANPKKLPHDMLGGMIGATPPRETTTYGYVMGPGQVGTASVGQIL